MNTSNWSALPLRLRTLASYISFTSGLATFLRSCAIAWASAFLKGPTYTFCHLVVVMMGICYAYHEQKCFLSGAVADNTP